MEPIMLQYDNNSSTLVFDVGFACNAWRRQYFAGLPLTATGQPSVAVVPQQYMEPANLTREVLSMQLRNCLRLKMQGV